jgi:hypothetical protein
MLNATIEYVLSLGSNPSKSGEASELNSGGGGEKPKDGARAKNGYANLTVTSLLRTVNYANLEDMDDDDDEDEDDSDSDN